jgi:hypothetical protein
MHSAQGVVSDSLPARFLSSSPQKSTETTRQVSGTLPHAVREHSLNAVQLRSSSMSTENHPPHTFHIAAFHITAYDNHRDCLFSLLWSDPECSSNNERFATDRGQLITKLGLTFRLTTAVICFGLLVKSNLTDLCDSEALQTVQELNLAETVIKECRVIRSQR